MSINDYDWQKIETFDERVEWQKSLAIEVDNICYKFANRFGKKDTKESWDKIEPDLTTNKYNDDIVEIYCETRYYDNLGTIRSTSINLVTLNTKVFSVTFLGGAKPNYTISCFRLGSWLNHMEYLRLRLESIEKTEEEKRKQEKAKYQERNFGRLD